MQITFGESRLCAGRQHPGECVRMLQDERRRTWPFVGPKLAVPESHSDLARFDGFGFWQRNGQDPLPVFNTAKT